ncbi:MAG TPA: S8/S53 family peptidase [Chitinophagaceae bacterium]|nr:S8/S53 family peptidase [Chitinophagaceae bacterium]
MRIHPIPFTILLCLFSIFSFSQKDESSALQLRSGKVFTEKNITQENVKFFAERLQKINGKSFAVLQFEELPSETKKQELAESGIQLLEYIPGKAFTICITKDIDYTILLKAGARSILELSPEQKMHSAMAKGIFPSWAIRTPGMVDVWISFPKTISFDEIKNLLRSKNIEITSTQYSQYHVIGLRIIRNRLNEIASFPFIEYIEPAPHGDQPLNYIAKQNSRGNVLNAAIGVGGYNLKGEGVVVGIGDDSDPQYHVDFTNRLIDFGPAGYTYHGTHVHGTIGGGGIAGEQYAGYAPKSTLVTQLLSGILSNASTYVTDYGMVVTNNSYGDVVGDCDYMGYYDLQSRVLDKMAIDLPNLQNVFAAGNDGGLTCSNYPSGFRTVLSGYQSAKNVLTIGATDRVGVVTSFSGRGPVKDGRTKPELMADGFFTISTVNTPDDGYGFQQGTSMSAPAVSGGLALLYEKYRLQNSGANPKSGLMKALICNGGTDLGNKGPDYTYGFGWMNLLRSVDMLSNNRYYVSTINNGGHNTHSISVPANTAQLKVTLYWNDPAAAVFSSQALINDLDLELTMPGPSTVLPYKLDTIPANVNNNAMQAADNINNIEQIVINNPATGTFTANIKGTAVASGPQEYFIVYDVIPNETKIVYPLGKEAWVPGETETIQWESYGDPANTFFVEYSTDNGGSWTTINAAVAANLRRLDWTVPSIQTTQALIRVKRNGTGYTSTSSAFTILGMPTLSLASVQCEGYFAFDWTAVAGATDYEVFQLQGTEMVSIGTTTSTNYILNGLSSNTEYWVTVCARLNGQRGRKAFAIKRIPNSGTCIGAISDNDIKMDSIIAPVYGRLNTSTALSATTIVSARIKNLDDANLTNFKMRYYVGGVLVIEDVVSTTVTSGTSYIHNFSVPYDFSAAGNYILKVEVENTTGADPVNVNNSITDTIRQLSNDPIPLPFTDNIEAATSRKYYANRYGIAGIERYDFTNTMPLGRFSTFLANGMAYSGKKSLMLDLDGWNGATGNTNFIYGTYNLNGINASVRDMRLDFQFKSHGDSVVDANNKIWVRGDDTKPWIEAFTLSSNGNVPGVFKRTRSIEISDLLIAASQNFTSSFQVRFGQVGRVRISDNNGFHGHNFDDIRIYEAIDDIQLKTIDVALSNRCGLTNAETVKVTIRNASSNSISNIPVRMVVDGGTPIIETIVGPLAADASMQYTFTAKANLLAWGDHIILINVQYGTDNFKDNDTLRLNAFNAPLITAFPHIENFETNDGYWRSSGNNNSWEYGVPASNKINKAASGTKAWKTNLTGNYKNQETSYLYSPCYNIAGMINPTLSLNIALDLEDCGGTLCDGAYFEYSGDGITWSRLGNVGTGTNWYNKDYGSGNKLWSVQDYTRWHVATTPLPTGIPTIRFRIVVVSDPFVNFEGIAIDDVHIYDNTIGVYDGVTMGSPVTQNISGGTSWINFISAGKLVASLQPNNQNLGNTAVQAFINTGGVRNDGKQYYQDRNITIKPTTTNLTDSVTVRFYFLDTETENLLNATGCANCTKPTMVTELGLTKYSDPDDNFENGNLADDIQGKFNFLSADWNYKIPFDKGYYVQFKTKDFSEFWLHNGAADRQTVLSGMIASFTTQKKDNNDVLVEWKTNSEQNIGHFEIEVAKGDINFQNNNFEMIGQVISPGNSNSERSYSFTDNEAGKLAIRYYRLKIVFTDNTFFYSPVRPVVFDDDIQWQVYPNPSNGEFKFQYNLAQNENMNVKIFDVNGRLVKEMILNGNGFVEQAIIDLRSVKFPAGVYLLSAEAGEKKLRLKLIKR